MTILQKHLIFIPVCFVLFGACFGYIVMLLWNWLMPSIFSMGQINFWQAVGLLFLCKILFGGTGIAQHCHGKHGHCGCNNDKNKLREKWENMTPEERKKVMEEIKNKCSSSDEL